MPWRDARRRVAEVGTRMLSTRGEEEQRDGSESTCGMVKLVPFEDLAGTDLVVDAVYEGRGGTLAGEPLSHLLPRIANLGGFRASGSGQNKRFVVLYSRGDDRDWPDHLDTSTGRFQYYGDNKTPGHELHETHIGGNNILRQVFDRLHDNPPQRNAIPPFFVFHRYPTPDSARSVQFRGLAVPGAAGLPVTEDLVAVWKTTDGQRFQNYRAVFSILDAADIKRAWIMDLAQRVCDSPHAPLAWREWTERGIYRVLSSENTTVVRTPEAQLPEGEAARAILDAVWMHFRKAPHEFEKFAARLFMMHDHRATIDQITQYARDGGRDAVGRYLLGIGEDPVYVHFALEAKCYRPALYDQAPVTVGVGDVARLISRIRLRQFGVLVTTSAVSGQAYREVRNDGHPIIFIVGKDIANILIDKGVNAPELVKRMLAEEYPV